MAEVSLTIGGRAYRLACRDGEEADLRAAAGLLDARVASLMQAHGAVAEPRLLLMAALLLGGELLEERNRTGRSPAPAQAAVPHTGLDAGGGSFFDSWYRLRDLALEADPSGRAPDAGDLQRRHTALWTSPGCGALAARRSARLQ